MEKSRFWGGVFIVAGTTVGGSMLALPLDSGAYGFFPSVLILLSMWALMSYTALLTLEVSLKYGRGVSISYMANDQFGALGRRISTISIIGLFYTLLIAYVSGGGSIIESILHHKLGMQTPKFVGPVVFGVIFCGLMYSKTQVLDVSNRALLLLKLALFSVMAYWLLPHSSYQNIVEHKEFAATSMVFSLPVFFTSFGFHGSIATIINYSKTNGKKLRSIFLIGSLIPLVVYILWEFLVLSALPMRGAVSLQEVEVLGGNPGALTQVLSMLIDSTLLTHFVQGFTFLAIATSFIGVGIGLFGFMEEQFFPKDTEKKRLKVWLLTFLPPILFATFYPNSFVKAIGFAAVALSLLAVIMPCMLILKLNKGRNSLIKTTAVLVSFIAGLAIILIQLYKVLLF